MADDVTMAVVEDEGRPVDDPGDDGMVVDHPSTPSSSPLPDLSSSPYLPSSPPRVRRSTHQHQQQGSCEILHAISLLQTDITSRAMKRMSARGVMRNKWD
jgi:hypothetical protein